MLNHLGFWLMTRDSVQVGEDNVSNFSTEKKSLGHSYSS
jgi:hypothetical protein